MDFVFDCFKFDPVFRIWKVRLSKLRVRIPHHLESEVLFVLVLLVHNNFTPPIVSALALLDLGCDTILRLILYGNLNPVLVIV